MKKTITAILLMCTMMLQGCSLFSFEDSEIMAPPKATGAKAEIQELIEDQTSSNYTLVYPKFGSNRSAIVTYDIDHDNEQEAIAFYTDKGGDDVHALFLEYEDEQYTVISDTVYDGNGVDRIEFADVDNNGIDEILIGYSTKTSSQNTLHIYTYGKKIKRFESTYQYSSLVTGDFNKDKCDDFLLISLYSGDIAATAKLMVYNKNGAFSELGAVELDSDITQLASAQFGKLSSETYGAVIDGVSSAGDYTTQVILYDNSRAQLLNPLFSYAGYSDTRRSTQVCSDDINKDEIIEIPLCSLMAHNESENTETICRKIDWAFFDISTYSLKVCLSNIICPADGYAVTIPNKWSTAVTARYDNTTHETIIYAYEYVKNNFKLSDKLITVKAFATDNFNKDSGFIEITTTGATTYAYRIDSTDHYLSVTGEEFISMFSLVNQ